jgi:hypothetical protein
METIRFAFSIAFAMAATARGERLPSQSLRALAAKMAAVISTALLRVSLFTGILQREIRGRKGNSSIPNQVEVAPEQRRVRVTESESRDLENARSPPCHQRMLRLAAEKPGPYFVFSSYTHESVASVDTADLFQNFKDECA